jgi:hypothetical protein
MVNKDELVKVLREQYRKAEQNKDAIFKEYGCYENVYKSKKAAKAASKLVGKIDVIEDICIALGIDIMEVARE